VSNVTVMNGMFQGASVFNGDISAWDVSSCVNFNNMLQNMNAFNQPLNSWNMTRASGIVQVGYMFANSVFNQPLNNWDTSKFNVFLGMFAFGVSFDQDISSWDTTGFTSSVAGLDFFTTSGLSTANYDALLIGWSAQAVRPSTNFNFGTAQYTLGGAAESARNTLINTYGWTITDGGGITPPPTPLTDATFNQAITDILAQDPNGDYYLVPYGKIQDWDVSQVTNMRQAFLNKTNFNGDISAWDTSSVTNMSQMFFVINGNSSFNQDLSAWDVSSVTNMQNMFFRADSFNQDLNNWDTSNVKNFIGVFVEADLFNQSLAGWDITGIDNTTDLNWFLQNATIDTANYDATLISWAAQTPLFSSLVPDFGNSQYTLGGAAESARNTLINTYGWTITDGGGI